MSVFVYVCVYLAHLPPVCDASDRGHNPELPTTTSSRSSARGREAPAGGSGWEKYPSKLEWWYSHAKPLNTLSPRFSLCLRYQPRRWEDMQRASLTPKANECEFPHCLSDGSFLSILSKSLISVVTFNELAKGSPRGQRLKKHPDLLCSRRTFITKVQVALAYEQSGQTTEQDRAPSALSEKV